MQLALNFDALGIEQMLMQSVPGIEIVKLYQGDGADCRADVVLTPMVKGILSLPDVLTRRRELR